MSRSDWGTLIILSMIWGSAFLFMKISLTALTPLTIVMIRVSIAALVLNLVVRLKGQRLPTDRKTWGTFLVMGLFNNLIPFSLIMWGQTHIPSSLASILNATTPIWTVLYANFLTRDEKMTTNKMTGVIFGFLGVAVMIGLDSLKGIGGNVLGQLAVIGAANCYAIAGIYGKRMREIPPLIAAAGQLTCSAVIMTPIALLVEKPWNLPMPGAEVWLALAALGLMCTALAYIIYFHLLARVGATNSMLVTFLVPIGAIFLGIIVLGEQLDTRHFLGMVLIAASLFTIDGRFLRKKTAVQENDG